MTSVPAISFLLLMLGGGSLEGQSVAAASQTVAEFDFWNWQAVKTPMSADGIVVDPQQDNVWYVASSSGLFITRDNGATWTQGLSDPVSKQAIAIDPFDAT